jgi:hypothetical protein
LYLKLDMNKLYQHLLCIFIIGVGALIAGSVGLFEHYKRREGFLQPGKPGVRCGVDLPTCSVGTQCLNGFCATTEMPPVIPNELPVYP